MGRGYVIEHCVSAINNTRKEEIYRVYTTECLRYIAAGVGREINMKYIDMIESIKPDSGVEEERTPEEIIESIRNKLKGEATA